MSTESLLLLHDKLREDHWRTTRPFTQDIEQAAKLILSPFAFDHEIAEAIRLWSLKHQPCQFGRIAASRRQIYVSVLRERDFADGDSAVAGKIASAKRHWKQRAVSNTHVPPHGFFLICVSHKLMSAAPDENLRRFSDRLLQLSGWSPKRRATRGDNPVSSDFLYLRRGNEYVGFQFNIDFFGSAGDGRWWHDHRLPGGVGLTANSPGHMKAFLDEYHDRGGDHTEWALTQAMLTIAQAHSSPTTDSVGHVPSPDGAPLTWLRDLDRDGGSHLPGIPCPIATLPKQLVGKDWTTYEGLIHTDHAVREEFFVDRDQAITRSAPYLQDFTYLYDRQQPDFAAFMVGIPFDDVHVFAELGEKNTWVRRGMWDAPRGTRSAEQDAAIHQMLNECRAWETTDDVTDITQA